TVVPWICSMTYRFDIEALISSQAPGWPEKSRRAGLQSELAHLGRLGQVERGKWLISLDRTLEGLHYAGDDGAI
ncbi:MAG: hypothetical protein WA633_20745, partial [Stellaceae bacterium]